MWFERRTYVGLTPTTQRFEGWPYGECVRAAYASILDLPLAEVPRFDPASLNGGDQRARERAWLAGRGLQLVEIAVPSDQQLPQIVLDEVPPTLVHLISGISRRGFLHRCVGQGGKVLFDPHPSRAGLESVFSIGILVPGRNDLHA